MILLSVFAAASENNWSPLGVIIFWQLQESISTCHNRVREQELLDCWMLFEYPCHSRTWGKHSPSRAASNSKYFSSCRITGAIYISWGLGKTCLCDLCHILIFSRIYKACDPVLIIFCILVLLDPVNLHNKVIMVWLAALLLQAQFMVA